MEEGDLADSRYPQQLYELHSHNLLMKRAKPGPFIAVLFISDIWRDCRRLLHTRAIYLQESSKAECECPTYIGTPLEA